MIKSNEVAFIEYKIKTMRRSELLAEINDAPLKKKELEFVLDIVSGFSLKELAGKYNVSVCRVSQRKRELFTRLFRYSLRA